MVAERKRREEVKVEANLRYGRLDRLRARLEVPLLPFLRHFSLESYNMSHDSLSTPLSHRQRSNAPSPSPALARMPSA